jgi:hypothetical protein
MQLSGSGMGDARGRLWVDFGMAACVLSIKFRPYAMGLTRALAVVAGRITVTRSNLIVLIGVQPFHSEHHHVA